jgi:GxxExxY protein
MDTDRAKLNELAKVVIGRAYTVANTLGAGFLEKVYENALAYELRRAGPNVEQQKPIRVRYNDVIVGDYISDLLVNNHVLVELKAVRPSTIHTALNA